MTRLVAFLCTVMSFTATSAMTYEQAREQALFLTDKMAYELNLNAEQYDAAYEINLDYLMSVTTVDDVYSVYWTRRNIDIEYILYDWQYAAYCARNYFYRPLYWDAGYWHFGIYSYYPHRDVFYFSRPTVYVSYRGNHGWRMNGGRSWYVDRTHHYRGSGTHHGMRDNYDRRMGHASHNGSNHSYDGNYNKGSRSSAGMHRGSNINRDRMSGSRNEYRNITRNETQSYTRGNMGTSRSNMGSSRGDYCSSTRTTIGSNMNMGSRSSGSMGSRGNNMNMGSRSSGSMGSRSSNFSGSRSSGSSFEGSTRSSGGSFSGGTRSSGGMSGGSHSGGMGRH